MMLAPHKAVAPTPAAKAEDETPAEAADEAATGA
jgi:hypothetical protein